MADLYEQRRQTVLDAFRAGWVALANGVPVAWDGDVRTLASTGTAYAVVAPRDGDAFQATVGAPGANTFRQSLTVLIQIFASVRGGATEARALALAFRDIANAVALPGVVVMTVPSAPGVMSVGRDPATDREQANMTASFRIDAQR